MLDPDELAYPDAFCTASAGSYKVRAVLDVDHNFAYDYNSSDGDLESEVIDQNFNPTSADVISVTLTKRKVDPPPQLPPHSERLDFTSPSLSEFWDVPSTSRVWSCVPPSYSERNAAIPPSI